MSDKNSEKNEIMNEVIFESKSCEETESIA